jgi:hypothetical protein
MAARTEISPRVTRAARLPAVLIGNRELKVIDPLIAIDVSEGWQTTTLPLAEATSGGALLRVGALPISVVKLLPSSEGGRPTAMLRQTLPDGRAVWVVEGPQAETEMVFRTLAASGLSISAPTATRPDYLGSDTAPLRTLRVAAVAAALPSDSVRTLAMGLLFRD